MNNREQAFNFITEMINCALKRGEFSSIERQGIQQAYQILNSKEEPKSEEDQSLAKQVKSKNTQKG